MRIPKTPMRMRREALERGKPAPPPPGEPRAAARPHLAGEPPEELDAVREWLAHIEAGRIATR